MGLLPACSAGSHLPDTQTEIWLWVMINILRRGHEMWLRKELKKKITFYSLSYTWLLSLWDRWWMSLLRVVDTKTWSSGLRRVGWADFHRLLLPGIQKEWFILRCRLDGGISLYKWICLILVNLFIFQDHVELPFVWVERHLIWTVICLYLSIWEDWPLWNLTW